MPDVNDVVVGALVGGLISLGSTIVVEGLRARRDKQSRWDRDRLEAMVELVACAQEQVGAQYRRGREVHDHSNDREHPLRLQREQEARETTNQLWVATARAKLVAPDAWDHLSLILDEAKTLRDLADRGFPSSDPTWRAAVDHYLGQIEALTRATSASLEIVGRRFRDEMPANG
jgi:hypothetical protein